MTETLSPYKPITSFQLDSQEDQHYGNEYPAAINTSESLTKEQSTSALHVLPMQIPTAIPVELPELLVLCLADSAAAVSAGLNSARSSAAAVQPEPMCPVFQPQGSSCGGTVQAPNKVDQDISPFANNLKIYIKTSY